MASYTGTLNLIKPDQTDFYDIADQNSNMDAIDTAIQGREPMASVGQIRTFSSPTYADDRYRLCDGGCLLASDYPQLEGTLTLGDGLWQSYGTLSLSNTDYTDLYAGAYGNNMMLLLSMDDDGDTVAHRSVYPTLWNAGGSVSSAQRAMVFADGHFYTVGASGSGYTTADGLIWTAMTGLADTASLYAIAYGNGRLVCVGINGVAYYSTDGSTWTAMTGLGDTDDDLYGVCYGDGRFVAVGLHARSYYSTNGTSWTAMTGLGSTDELRAVCYGNGRFVAVGSDGVAYASTNGTSWIAMSGLDTELNFESVVYGAGQFVAVSGTAAYGSSDGASWQLQQTYTESSASNEMVLFVNGQFRWFYNSGYNSSAVIKEAFMTPDGYYRLPCQCDVGNQLYGYLKVLAD